MTWQWLVCGRAGTTYRNIHRSWSVLWFLFLVCVVPVIGLHVWSVLMDLFEHVFHRRFHDVAWLHVVNLTLHACLLILLGCTAMGLWMAWHVAGFSVAQRMTDESYAAYMAAWFRFATGSWGGLMVRVVGLLLSGLGLFVVWWVLGIVHDSTPGQLPVWITFLQDVMTLVVSAGFLCAYAARLCRGAYCFHWFVLHHDRKERSLA